MTQPPQIWTVYVASPHRQHRFEDLTKALVFIMENLSRGQACRLIDPQDRAWGIVALAPGVKAQVVIEV